MKNVFFMIVLFLSVNSFADFENRTIVTGRVGKMVLDAMKYAGVQPANCNEHGSCDYVITNFESADEGDGCGGGTTSYEAEFTYADKTKFTFHYCEGSRSDGGENPAKAKTNKAKELTRIFNELGYDRTGGWRSSITLEKIECYASRVNAKDATCQLWTPAQK